MDEWMPGAEVVAGAHAGGTLVGGPPRCTWHITWDKLDPRPTFDNVRDYLVRQNFEPTLMWDPETGRTVEFLSGLRSAYAVRNLAGGVETNRYGDVHVQIEVFFSPGYGGNTLFTDGPLVGLEKIMQWLDQLGIPRVAACNWDAPSRDVDQWLNNAGHFGHFAVPENDHTDPIAGTDIGKILAAGHDPVPPQPPEDIMFCSYVLRQGDETVWRVGGGLDPVWVIYFAEAEYIAQVLGLRFNEPADPTATRAITDGAKVTRQVWIVSDNGAAEIGIPSLIKH